MHKDTRLTPIAAIAAITLHAGVIDASPPQQRFRPPAPPSSAGVLPAGRYVLTAESGTATAGNALEIKAPFRLRTGQYVLSGGPRASDPIVVDDDLTISVGNSRLFEDDDHVRSDDARSGIGRRYAGEPIVLVVPGEKLRVRATDHCGTEAHLGPLYLHRHDGAYRRLTDAIERQSATTLPHTFFDREFNLKEGFTGPSTVGRAAGNGQATLMPPSPADLLPAAAAGDLLARLEAIQRELVELRRAIEQLQRSTEKSVSRR
jgi:hypothetical protein